MDSLPALQHFNMASLLLLLFCSPHVTEGRGLTGYVLQGCIRFGPGKKARPPAAQTRRLGTPRALAPTPAPPSAEGHKGLAPITHQPGSAAAAAQN